MISVSSFFKSVLYALRGLNTAFHEEQNIRIHSIAAIFVFLLSYLCKLSAIEVSLVALSVGFVIAAELINSALERLIDSMKPRMMVQVAHIKDMLAGSVGIAALSACIVGLCVFTPKLYVIARPLVVRLSSFLLQY